VAGESLVLGPLMRHVDETSAAIWVETRGAATVVVQVQDRTWAASTFAVHDHHYALVEVDGLEPGAVAEYTVEIDQQVVWPPPGSPYPPSRIATLKRDKPPRLAFGSCRTTISHDAKGNLIHGVDALRAYALRMSREDTQRWPDLVLFLGDQVYADETSEEMKAFIEARRDIDEPPGAELKDYEEYAHLYQLAWTEPANRWLLSTLPSLMIFDDHDIRDDWNTSAQWRREMEATSWWHGRIVGGLASYWVYQHLGNLSPAERAEDEIWRTVAEHHGDAEPDLTATLDAFAARVDQEPDSYRWSYARDIGKTRLVVVDSRAARVLRPERRSILDAGEMAWLDEQMRGDVDHLLVGTSLPFLLGPGLHHMEAWSEAVASGGWGTRLQPFGEWMRQATDLEHWAAFQEGFRKVAGMVIEIALGGRGRPPKTITFLSGDVHHSYVAEVRRPANVPPGTSRIVQAVCSPIRNPLPRLMRFATAAVSYGLAGPLGRLATRSAKVPDPPFQWDIVEGPWYDNSLATLEVVDDGLRMRWETGVIDNGDHDNPRVELVASVTIPDDTGGA
jgi:PhoD-like phosphatase